MTGGGGLVAAARGVNRKVGRIRVSEIRLKLIPAGIVKHNL